MVVTATTTATIIAVLASHPACVRTEQELARELEVLRRSRDYVLDCEGSYSCATSEHVETCVYQWVTGAADKQYGCFGDYATRRFDDLINVNEYLHFLVCRYVDQAGAPTAPASYTIQIEVRAEDGTWQAIAPSEQVMKVATPNGAALDAVQAIQNQNVISDPTPYRVVVWTGTDVHVRPSAVRHVNW